MWHTFTNIQVQKRKNKKKTKQKQNKQRKWKLLHSTLGSVDNKDYATSVFLFVGDTVFPYSEKNIVLHI